MASKQRENYTNFHEKGANWRLFWLFFTFSLSLSSAAAAAPAGPCTDTRFDEMARVAHVHDGDTVRLEDGRKIRLIGINTPEVARDQQPAEAYADAARELLQRRLAASDFRVGLIHGQQDEDRYGRSLAHLYTPEGHNLQAGLLGAGLATANTFPPNTRLSACYHQVEAEARCARQGLWSEPTTAVLASNELAPGVNGFHRLSGRVERVSLSTRGARLTLQGGVLLGIHADDLGYFDKTWLQALENRHVLVRGWLNPKSGSNRAIRYYLRIRHPSSMLELDGTDYMQKC